jgi:hypothetical protein
MSNEWVYKMIITRLVFVPEHLHHPLSFVTLHVSSTIISLPSARICVRHFVGYLTALRYNVAR